MANLLSLPEEVLGVELSSKIPVEYLFVLSKVSKGLRALLKDVDYGNLFTRKRPFSAFCKDGYLNLIQWDQEGPAPSFLIADDFEGAIGNVEILRFLHSKNCPMKKSCGWKAVSNGIIECILFLRSLGFSESSGFYQLATSCALKNDFSPLNALADAKILDWADFFSSFSMGDLPEVTRSLSEYLQSKGYDPKSDDRYLDAVARSGDCEWLEAALKSDPSLLLVNPLPSRQSRSPILSELYRLAAEYGHLHIMEALKKHSVELPEARYLGIAIENGQLECLLWLHSNGINVFSEKRVQVNWKNAIAQGKFKSPVTLFTEYGLLPSAELYVSAVIARDRDLLEYFENQNCPIDHYSYRAAAKVGDIAMIKRLLAKGIGKGYNSGEPVAAAVEYGHLECLKFLLENGFEYEEEVDQLPSHAFNSKSMEMVQYVCGHMGLVIGDYALGSEALKYPRPNEMLLALKSFAEIDLTSTNEPSPESFAECLCRDLIRVSTLKILKSMDLGIDWGKSFAVAAAVEGRIDFLDWLVEEGIDVNWNKIAKKLMSDWSLGKLTSQEQKVLTWIKAHRNPAS